VEAVVGTLAPHTLMLTEAFAVPGELLEDHPMLRLDRPASLVPA
jgi:acyl-CoA oxidase